MALNQWKRDSLFSKLLFFLWKNKNVQACNGILSIFLEYIYCSQLSVFLQKKQIKLKGLSVDIKSIES